MNRRRTALMVCLFTLACLYCCVLGDVHMCFASAQFSISDDANRSRSDDDNQSPVGTRCQHNAPRCLRISGEDYKFRSVNGFGGTYTADTYTLSFPCRAFYGV